MLRPARTRGVSQALGDNRLGRALARASSTNQAPGRLLGLYTSAAGLSTGEL